MTKTCFACNGKIKTKQESVTLFTKIYYIYLEGKHIARNDEKIPKTYHKYRADCVVKQI